MPELPEVETILRRLKPLLIGKVLAEITVFHTKSFHGNASVLEGKRITALSRRAKMLLIDFSGEFCLLIHLKMTGQLIYEDANGRAGGGHPTTDFVTSLPSKHTRVLLSFVNGGTLFFNDQRLFGWMRVVAHQDIEMHFRNIALDVIDPNYTLGVFAAAVARKTASSKQVIMDPSVMAGVGNIYACDALNLAKLHPSRSASSLSKTELKTVLAALKTVLQLGIEYQGATVHAVDATPGLTGTYQHIRRVYQKEGEPCPNCTAPIVKVKLGGRGTFFCPICQR